MKTKFTPGILALAATLLSTLIHQPSTSFAQGTAFTYQGRLNDGANPASGTYDLRFTIYDSSGGPAAVAGPLTHSPTAVSNGLFTVTLDFGSGVFTGAERWLEIAVRTNGGGAFSTLTPRQPVTASPYAIHAANAATAATSGAVAADAVATAGLQAGAVTSGKIADGTISPSDVNAALFATTFWKTDGNAGTTAGTHFVGTSDNQALELKVKNWRGLRLEPTPEDGFHFGIVNVIGGSPANSVAPGVFGATIAGGGAVYNQGIASTNRVAASFATVGGGYGNQIAEASDRSTIAGGSDNQIETSAFASSISGGIGNRIESGSDFASVSGVDNTIGSDTRGCTIAGGEVNAIGYQSDYGAVGGGRLNIIEDKLANCTIAGGQGGLIRGEDIWNPGDSDNSTIGGGFFNTVQRRSPNSTIAGGFMNSVESDAPSATISGGHDNAIRFYVNGATIGGGGANTNFGYYGTIPGGRLNRTESAYTLAAGQNAQALHARSFVWSSRLNPAPSFSADRFHIHATEGFSVDYAGQRPDGGGQRWVILGSVSDFPGQTISTWTGAKLTDGGVWTDNSDRAAKENFTSVDPREILEQVSALPVQQWNYKTEGPDVRHIGPVAQDFHAAFGTGNDDKHLAALDSAGVALAAIQGLNEKVEGRSQKTEASIRTLETKLEQKETEITKLKQRLSALEQVLANFNAKGN